VSPEFAVLCLQSSAFHPSFHSSNHPFRRNLSILPFIQPSVPKELIHPSIHPAIRSEGTYPSFHSSNHPFRRNLSILPFIQPSLAKPVILIIPFRRLPALRPPSSVLSASCLPREIFTPLNLFLSLFNWGTKSRVERISLGRLLVCVFLCGSVANLLLSAYNPFSLYNL